MSIFPIDSQSQLLLYYYWLLNIEGIPFLNATVDKVRCIYMFLNER